MTTEPVLSRRAQIQRLHSRGAFWRVSTRGDYKKGWCIVIAGHEYHLAYNAAEALEHLRLHDAIVASQGKDKRTVPCDD